MKPLGEHARAADAAELRIRVVLAQSRHQAGAENISRCLAHDHANAHTLSHDCFPQRTIPRAVTFKESISGPSSAQSARITFHSAMPSSTGNPRRYSIWMAVCTLALPSLSTPRLRTPSVLMLLHDAGLPAAIT